MHLKTMQRVEFAAASVAGVVAVLVALLLSACVGNQARNKALLPAIQTAWPIVHGDLRYAIDNADWQDRQQLIDLTDQWDRAITSANQEQISLLATTWPLVRSSAEWAIMDRIAKGQISVGVGDSKREVLNNFEEAVYLLARVPVTIPRPSKEIP